MTDKNQSNDVIIEDDVEQQQKQIAVPTPSYPEKVYIIPIHNRPFFPAQILPVIVNQEPWEETLRRVAKTDHQSIAIFYSDEPFNEGFNIENLPRYGTLVKIHHVSKENDKLQFVAQGIARVKIKGLLSHKPPYLAEVEYPKYTEESNNEVRAYGMALINAIKELLPLNPLYSEELKNYLNRFSPNEPSPLTDFAAAITTANGDELQKVLETIPILKRMEKVLPLLRREVEIAHLQNQLSTEVNEKISKHQREFFLKEQLKIIQRDLGITKDDKSADADEFQARLKGKLLPEQAQQRIDEELHKLTLLETGSPEYAVTRNYLDWATALPWGVIGKDKLNLKHAQKVLSRPPRCRQNQYRESYS